MRADNLELIKQIRRLEGRISALERQGAPGAMDMGFMGAIGMLQTFPGLVGLWPGSSLGSGITGNLHYTDLSGHGLDLTRNGSTFVFGGTNGLYSNYWFNGTTGYANHADAGIFDIVGNESGIWVNQRGLALGGWFRFDVGGNSEGMLTKAPSLFGTPGAYGLYKGSGNALRFSISNGAVVNNSSTLTVPIGEWIFACGVFDALNTELVTYLGTAADGLQAITDSTGAVVSIQNTTDQFVLGGTSGGGNLFDGQASLCFLSAAAVPEAMINAFYQYSKGLFT